MKITVICSGGVIPACLDHVNYTYMSNPGRIRILEFETDDVEMLRILNDDPDVMSFEITKVEKWADFFPLKPIYEVNTTNGKNKNA